MSQNNNVNNNVRNNDLLNKSVNVDPIGVIYSITSTDVENYVYNLLQSKGIDGVQFVKCVVSGNEKRPEVQVGVFMNKHSKNIRSNSRNNDIADFLKKQLDSGLYYPDNDLATILKPLTHEVKLQLQGNQVICLLDIFRVLGLMLLVNPRFHNINIAEATRVKKESVMIVYKTVKQNNSFNDNDSAAKTLMKLSKR